MSSVKELIHDSSLIEAGKEFSRVKGAGVFSGLVGIAVECENDLDKTQAVITSGESEWFWDNEPSLYEYREVLFHGESRYTRSFEKIEEKISAGRGIKEWKWKRNRLPGAWRKAVSDVTNALGAGVTLETGMSASDVAKKVKEKMAEEKAPEGAADRTMAARFIDAAEKCARYGKRLNVDDLEKCQQIIHETFGIDISFFTGE